MHPPVEESGPGDLRVDQLAARAEVSVDTIRFYQARGLLPPPRRQGRVAWYDVTHLERLDRIRRLQEQGLSLATIHRLLAGQLDAADEALARALGRTADVGPADATVQGPGVTGPATPAREHSTGQSHDPRLLTLEELGAETGIPVALLAAVEREGLLVAREVAGHARYTAEDVAVARAGLCLLELGLPLADVLDLARQHHQAVLVTAERAVALFDAHIRQPLRAARVPDTEAATRLVEAFQALLPATVSLVSHHFRRTLLAVAQDHIERVGDVAEVHAVRAESARWGEDGQAGSGRR